MRLEAGDSVAPTESRLPEGFAVVLDRRVRRIDERILIGGSPIRILRLSPTAQHILRSNRFVVEDATSALIARRLLDAGMAHPRPRGDCYGVQDVTIVVPVRNRVAMLGRLLRSLEGGPPVIVVDDGSDDPSAIEEITKCHGAKLLRHSISRGPGAARNTGLRDVMTPLVAFIDSDCVAVGEWLKPLVIHFDDPAVALAAPRVVALTNPGARHALLVEYEAARSSLDRGREEALVAKGGMLSWVPSAALLARRSALGPGFAEQLCVGEDVDLVWRLQEVGWQVRYEPSGSVAHDHRTEFWRWAERKARYGSSAAVLARRHGRRDVAPIVLSSWAAVCWVLVLLQRRHLAVGGLLPALAVTCVLAHRLPPRGGRLQTATGLTIRGFGSAGLQLSSAMVRAWWPLSAAACAVSHRARRAVITAGLLDGILDWLRCRPRMDPLTYTVLRRIDDLAYGLGLWAGVLNERSLQPLLPVVVFRSSAVRSR